MTKKRTLLSKQNFPLLIHRLPFVPLFVFSWRFICSVLCSTITPVQRFSRQYTSSGEEPSSQGEPDDEDGTIPAYEMARRLVFITLLLQWNLWTKDTLGAGLLSTAERFSLSRRLTSWPQPQFLSQLIQLGVAYKKLNHQISIENALNSKNGQNRGMNGLSE